MFLFHFSDHILLVILRIVSTTSQEEEITFFNKFFVQFILQFQASIKTRVRIKPKILVSFYGGAQLFPAEIQKFSFKIKFLYPQKVRRI